LSFCCFGILFILFILSISFQKRMILTDCSLECAGAVDHLRARGLDGFGMEGVDPAQAAKWTAEKQVLAWSLCRRTAMRRHRVSGRSAMWDESRVTQAIRQAQQAADAGLARLKRKT
jgi:hypothetical protein